MIVLPFATVAAAMLVATLLVAYFVVVRPWLLKGGGIPVIGRVIRGAVAGIERFVIDTWNDYIERPAVAVGQFFSGIGRQLQELPEALSALAGDVRAAVEHLVEQTIPAAVATLRRYVVERVNGLDDLVDDLAGRLATFRRGIDARVDRVEDAIANTVGRATRAALDQLELYARGIDRRLDQLGERLARGVERDVDRLERVTVPRITDRLGDVEDVLADVAPWVLGLAGAVTLTQAIDGVRAASRAKPKLDRLCTLDLDEVEDLLGFAMGALALTELVELVREGAVVAHEMADEVRTIVRVGN